MAYEAQSKILDIESKILAKNGPPSKREHNPIIVPLEQTNNNSPSKGNKSAVRAVGAQQ
jgi:hypothetical protein